jgi:AraC family transcriptional activator of tynA and feaB
MAAASVRPPDINGFRSCSLTLHRVKDFVERHLADPDLNAALVASAVGLSSRYVNDLFEDEGTSLMRHVWRRRLEKCRKDLQDPAHVGHRVPEIAFRWGFNDLLHFSRAFRQRFGSTPRGKSFHQSDAIAGLQQNSGISRRSLSCAGLGLGTMPR